MADASQGLFSFPGIDTILTGSFTLTPGFRPSVCTLSIAPQPKAPYKVGELRLTYGGTTLKFKDCAVDNLQAMIDPQGREVWQATILDRRWRWAKQGRISGYYNVHRGAILDRTKEIVPGTEKTPKELAQLCLDALGEKNADLSKLPRDQRPEIEWDYMLPAEALAQLCDRLQCVCVLGLDDRVKILPKDEGKKLPINNVLLQGAAEVDPPEKPEELCVVTAPLAYQMDLELIPVGLDTDWSIRPLEELSYKPTVTIPKAKSASGKEIDIDTWACADVQAPPGFMCVTGIHARSLARQSVFRWYQIKLPIALASDWEIDNLDRILPLLDNQLLDIVQQGAREKSTSTDTQGRLDARPAVVYGQFFRKKEAVVDDGALWEKEKKHTLAGEIPKGMKLYEDGFSVNAQLGIVQFSQPVYDLTRLKDLDKSLDGEGLKAAKLFLRVAFNIRDPATRGWLRGEYAEPVDGAPKGKKEIKGKDQKTSTSAKQKPPEKTGPKNPASCQHFRHDDLQPKAWLLPGEAWKSNVEEIKKQAMYYLKEHRRQYVTQTPATGTYAGFQRFEPDGLITQVTWWTDDAGYARTKAVSGKEDLLDIVAYDERRLMERILEDERQKPATQREEAERQRRSRA